jgi:hypothetical protein
LVDESREWPVDFKLEEIIDTPTRFSLTAKVR